MNCETYYSLRKFVPPEARKRMVIAGGYAARPETAGDIDLWILADEDGEFDGSRIVSYLRGQAEIGEAVQSKTYEQQSLCAAIPAKIMNWGAYNATSHWTTSDHKSLHVLVTPATTVQELVDSFDISTHAIALDGGRFTFAKFYTSPRVTPVISRFNTPKQTLARLQKICARYDIKARPQDLEQLEYLAMCEGVVEGLAA